MTEAIFQYVLHGPEAGGESILRRALGFYVWWRTWLMLALIFGSLVALTADSVGTNPRFYGWAIGIVTAVIIDEVMPDEF